MFSALLRLETIIRRLGGLGNGAYPVFAGMCRGILANESENGGQKSEDRDQMTEGGGWTVRSGEVGK
jgi:hypothetical protein